MSHSEVTRANVPVSPVIIPPGNVTPDPSQFAEQPFQDGDVIRYSQILPTTETNMDTGQQQSISKLTHRHVASAMIENGLDPTDGLDGPGIINAGFWNKTDIVSLADAGQIIADMVPALATVDGEQVVCIWTDNDPEVAPTMMRRGFSNVARVKTKGPKFDPNTGHRLR
jgi:hypothetical protein